MRTIYRLTVRTEDGTRFISDYEEEYKAQAQMNKFFVPDKNLVSYRWALGGDVVLMDLRHICSTSLQKIDIEETDPKKFNIETCEISKIQPSTYIGQIHIEEAR